MMVLDVVKQEQGKIENTEKIEKVVKEEAHVMVTV
jgi:hypothetical protein